MKPSVHRFFHPDFNRWLWNLTKSTTLKASVAGFLQQQITASGELHPAPKTALFLYY